MEFKKETIGLVKEQNSLEFNENGYTEYGVHVLSSRALPSLIDGCKVLHRRTLYEASKMPEKLAKVPDIGGRVMRIHPHGNCLKSDTKVFMLDGNHRTIKELYEEGSDQSVLVVDSSGNLSSANAHSFRVGTESTKNYIIHFTNGGSIEATGNHEFLSMNGQWISAEDLREGYVMDTTTLSQSVPFTEGSEYSTTEMTESNTTQLVRLAHQGCSTLFTLSTADAVTRVSNRRGKYQKDEPSQHQLYLDVSSYYADVISKNLEDGSLCINDHKYDRIRDYILQNTTIVSKIDVVTYEDPETMYDFTVDDYHNMLVFTSDDVLTCVHNSDAGVVSMGFPGKARMFRTKGNFGGHDIGASASRYLEAYLEHYARLCFTQFAKYTDFIEGESGHQEPEHLPVLLPYSHIQGGSGMGVGISTDILPLDLMGLIDYFIDIVKGEESPRIPKPDLGGVLVDMDDDEWKSAVMNHHSRITTKSIITQESDTTLVIDALNGRNEIAVLKKVQRFIDEDILDYRNESNDNLRMVFDIVDLRKLSISELRTHLENATVSNKTYRRVVTHNNKAIYCDLRYQADATLKYLNKVLDRKFSQELRDLQYSIVVYRIIEYMKESGMVERLPKMTDKEVISEIIATGNEDYKEEHIKSALSKSIKYLTKSHHEEISNAEAEIAKLTSVNRTDYLVSLYEELREAISPLYNSVKHTKVRSELLVNPRVQYQPRKKTISVGSRGDKFNNKLILVDDDSYVSSISVQSDVYKEIDSTVVSPGKLVGISTDAHLFTLVVTNHNRALMVDNSKVYNKHIMKLDEGEKVVKVLSYDTKLFKYEGKEYDSKWFIKSRVAIPNKL